MRPIWIAILMMMTLFAGCVDDAGDAKVVSLTVIDASSTDEGNGFCGYGPDEECHSFTVSVANGADEDFSTNMFYWDAVGDDGGVYSTPSVDGPDAIAAGATVSISLHFDVLNGVKLTTLKWEPIFAEKLSTSIPSYDHVVTFNVTLTVDSGTSADEGDGYCGYDESEECHIFNITVTNNGVDEFSTSRYNWEAVGDDGGIYDSPDVDGPAGVAVGATTIITLYFDVTNEVKLNQLKWSDYSNEVDASIPVY
jgi:hypothetical protein